MLHLRPHTTLYASYPGMITVEFFKKLYTLHVPDCSMLYSYIRCCNVVMDVCHLISTLNYIDCTLKYVNTPLNSLFDVEVFLVIVIAVNLL